jgi:tetratricopeptide (TPR) repeat protein
VQGENIDDDTKAEWYYELAVVSNAKEEFCKAIEYAREAIRLNNNYGKALILLGDAYIASRNNLGDEFQQRAAFWAAADKYQEAARLDPDNAEDARKKLNNYKSQYPDNEEVFFRDMNDGDPYQIGGCINENTTVRSRK